MMLLRSIITVGGLTMVSRVLGFCRDILIATFLGAGVIADVFFVAFKAPNLFGGSLQRALLMQPLYHSLRVF